MTCRDCVPCAACAVPANRHYSDGYCRGHVPPPPRHPRLSALVQRCAHYASEAAFAVMDSALERIHKEDKK